MAEVNARAGKTLESANGSVALETRLRGLFAEQQRLRILLEQTRADLDAVNAEVLRFQDEYCTDAAREMEYDGVLEQILGVDLRIDFNEIQEFLSGKRGRDMADFIKELEEAAETDPSRGAE